MITVKSLIKKLEILNSPDSQIYFHYKDIYYAVTDVIVSNMKYEGKKDDDPPLVILINDGLEEK